MFSSGCVAQLVEQLTLNQWVQGSSPCASTRNNGHNSGRFLWYGHMFTRQMVVAFFILMCLSLQGCVAVCFPGIHTYVNI